MPLLEEHAKYHAMSPKDVFTKEGDPISHVDIARTTSATGEQLHIVCPIYKDDSREELNERVNFCFSVLQDRLDEENKAVEKLNETAQRRSMIGESMKRNEAKLHQEVRDIRKEAKKAGWKLDTVDSKIAERKEALKKATELLYDSMLPEDREFFEKKDAMKVMDTSLPTDAPALASVPAEQ